MSRSRALRRATLLATIAWLSAFPAAAQQQAASSQHWEADIHQFEIADSVQAPPRHAVLFVGSSSIRLWTSLAGDFPGVPTLNRGFGGSEMSDVLYFADRIIDPYSPRVVVVYAGDNDLANGKSPGRVADDFRRLVARIHYRLPATRVVFVSIKPSLARWNLVAKIRAVNQLVRRQAAADRRLAYADVFSPMLGADGKPRKELFVDDGLHMTPAGYAIWTRVIAPYIR